MESNTSSKEDKIVSEEKIEATDLPVESKAAEPDQNNESDLSVKEAKEGPAPAVAETVAVIDEAKSTEAVKEKKRLRKPIFSSDTYGGPPPKKKPEVEDFMPLEVLQTLQQLAIPKLGNNGLPCRPKAMTIVDGRPTFPDMEPLQQCQHLQQVQGLIHYHEQQVKYRSYIQLEMLRSLRKQLNDQMMLHPHRHNYDALVEAAKNNRLTPLSMAERAQLEYFNQMADWTLEARSSLQNKESQLYLSLFGRQVSEFKSRMNEITTHEQFNAFGPMFAERIDYHRELIHTLNRRCSVSIA
ncbi:hypothetical protein CAEBREN_24727 [Caenorhabditis brenneri]|uniref:Uncharacterized protein n=1 Tax=Caenorhabditis brenneri TaxID=135651 RepID=G0MH13_CAEBE|nr:hypothetical protein CAEBREN_24727 [Caenorhabditis brenneri]